MSVEQWIQSGAALARGWMRSLSIRRARAWAPRSASSWPGSRRGSRVRVVQPGDARPRPRRAHRCRAFVLEDLRLFDFYPQTSHIESVAHLALRG